VKCAYNKAVLDLSAEEDRLNVYAGELDVRPPLKARDAAGSGFVRGVAAGLDS
jgi:hypothetical protein